MSELPVPMNFSHVARQPSTNNYFELLPLDAKGEPWCDARPRAALVQVIGGSKFNMSATWEVTHEVAHPRRVAVLLAGVVIGVYDCNPNDHTYERGERMRIRHEIAFNRSR